MDLGPCRLTVNKVEISGVSDVEITHSDNATKPIELNGDTYLVVLPREQRSDRWWQNN